MENQAVEKRGASETSKPEAYASLANELQLALSVVTGLAEILLEETRPEGLSYHDLRTLLRFSRHCEQMAERLRKISDRTPRMARSLS